MNENKLTKEALTAFAEKNRERFESLLKDFVELPTVSVDPTKKNAIRDASTLAADTIRRSAASRPSSRRTATRSSTASGATTPPRPDRHRLQPPRRPARLEGDRAVGDRALRLHEEGGPLLRPRHDRRQGPGPLRPLRREGRARRRSPGEHPRPLGVRGGDRLAELREGDHGGEGQARDRLRHRLRHDLDRPRQAGLSGRPPRPAGDPLHARDRDDRPALGRHRRRRAQPDRRADEARLRVLRRQDREGEDPRLLRRRGPADEGRARGLPEVRLHGRRLQEGPPVQVDPHERRPRRDEAHLGDADVRDPRRRRRLHGPRRQDGHPAARRGQGLLPARPEPDGREDREARRRTS